MSELRVTRLRCEYLVDPLGIDETAPRLSWCLETPRRGARQLACRIRVASTAAKLSAGDADRWDSGRLESDQTAHVAYAGAPLRSRDTCHWDVEVWDETGASIRSAPALWTMGLLEKADWSARWIAADPEIIRRDPQALAPTLTEPGTPAVFRRVFDLPASAVRRATVYASARGLFELRLGSRRVGEDLFAPEWTDYFKRIHYRTYDVTALLAPGRNELSAVLGDGWWSGYVGWQEQRGRYGSLENSLLVQLEVALANGARMVFGTDGSWQCATGPILSSDFMMGEAFDARREPRAWLPALEVPAPSAALVAQRSEPVRIVETLAPVSRVEIRPGVWIYDLGQNIAGWVRLKSRRGPGRRRRLDPVHRGSDRRRRKPFRDQRRRLPRHRRGSGPQGRLGGYLSDRPRHRLRHLRSDERREAAQRFRARGRDHRIGLQQRFREQQYPAQSFGGRGHHRPFQQHVADPQRERCKPHRHPYRHGAQSGPRPALQRHRSCRPDRRPDHGHRRRQRRGRGHPLDQLVRQRCRDPDADLQRGQPRRRSSGLDHLQRSRQFPRGRRPDGRCRGGKHRFELLRRHRVQRHGHHHRRRLHRQCHEPMHQSGDREAGCRRLLDQPPPSPARARRQTRPERRRKHGDHQPLLGYQRVDHRQRSDDQPDLGRSDQQQRHPPSILSWPAPRTAPRPRPFSAPSPET